VEGREKNAGLSVRCPATREDPSPLPNAGEGGVVRSDASAAHPWPGAAGRNHLTARFVPPSSGPVKAIEHTPRPGELSVPCETSRMCYADARLWHLDAPVSGRYGE
jgi:hypothetical protein